MVTTSAGANTPLAKILVVDDEPELRSVLVKSLQKHGYEVAGAGSGHDALTRLRERDFDLLLTDLMMPEMDGIALLKAALEIDPHLIGIMLTGRGTIQTAVDAMQVGAFDYVLKPFRLQNLLPVLTRALNTRQLRLENLQLRETVAIHELSQTIAFTLDPQTVMSKLTEAALLQSEADEVSVLLPTADGKEFYVAAARGEHTARLLGERIPFDRGIASWVARERKAVILNGEVKDDRFEALWPRPAISSSVSVPMVVANKLIGVLNLNVINRHRPFALGQMKALSILAGTAAAALESASLYTQVRTTEEKYRAIFENATEGLFQTTAGGRLLTANPALARILGYDSPEDMIAIVTDLASQIYVNPEDRVDASRLQEESGVLLGFEMEAYRKDREKIWVSVNRRAVRNPDGALLYFEGSVEDITARRQVEEEKRKIRQQYESLVHTIDGIVWELDVNTLTFTFISKQSEKILGYTPEQWVNDPSFWENHLHPDDRAWALEFCRVALTKREDHEFDYRMIAADGHTVWLRDIVVVDKTNREHPLLRGVMVDITERKRVEEALTESERRKDAILKSALDCVITIDHEGKIVDFNPAAERQFGYTSEHAMGKKMQDLIVPPSLRASHKVGFARYLATGSSSMLGTRIETAAMRSDGSEFPIELTVTAIGKLPRPMFTAFLRDLTERNRAEAELRKSEERYRDLVENAHDLIYEHDLKGRYTATNKAGERMTGYSLEESLELNLAQTVAPECLEKAKEMLQRKLAGESVTAYELVILGKDGHRVPVEVNTRLVLKDGVPVGVQGIARDITERKRVEETQARRADHALFRADVSAALTMGNAPLKATLEACADAMVHHLDAAFARIWTLNPEEAMLELQASAGMYTHIDGPHSRVPVGSFKIGKIAEERAPHITNEVQTDPRVGDKEWARREGMVAFAGYPLLLENRVLGVMAMFAREQLAEDTLDALAAVSDLISQGIERRRTEEELRENEERYRMLFDSNPQPMWVYDLETLAFLAVNGSAVRHYGYSQEEFLGMTIEDIRPAAEIPSLHASLADSLEEVGLPRAWRHVKKDGTLIEVEITSHLLVFDGRRAELILAHDITERQRLEAALLASQAQLRQSQKLEAIGQLAGGVAHDFNNLLTAINGYSALALRRLGDDHPIASYLEEIKKAGDRAANLTRQLLAFGRKQLLQPLSLNLNDIVLDMNKMLKRLIGENIDLVAKLNPSLKQIKADPGQVEQVLVNLVVNARDAMPRGGTLTIETANAQLDGVYASKHVGVIPGSYIMLVVSDTGMGMDQETQARMFEPFFTTKEKGKGTGLGLSTVYGIVRQSGGNVWVYSELNRGTSFKIFLPQIDGEDGVNGDSVSVSGTARGSETVLLVEDEDMVRNLATEILKDSGYTVLEASGGEEAIGLCREHREPIHLLITDVVMPRMSGKDVAQQLQMIHPETKVLFMSGYTDEAIVHHGIVDADIAFIQKPFSENALALKIREVLDSEMPPGGLGEIPPKGFSLLA
ncbi:MAG: PAS domain S-box protein [Pyrinomonadaceae bacterium]|nr:PAS domain S-box protein [Pyrinomonadaceae bacterium]